MKRFRTVSCWVFLAFLFLFSTKAWAVNADDYYRVGLLLYNAKVYAKAIQSFNAAMTVDPQKTAAYQGRANCYYATGRTADALLDYQRVQKMTPSPQLDQFIQKLQASMTVASPMPFGLVSAPAGDETSASFFEKG